MDEAVRQFHLAQDEELEETEGHDKQHVRQSSSTSVSGNLLRGQSEALVAARDVAQAAQEETARLREQLQEAQQALASMRQKAQP